jgi:hypothetical protein
LPYQVFRQSIDLHERRRAGTFFSGTALSDRIASMLRARLHAEATVMDPTCGIGDLLLAYARLLPIQGSLEATLAAWSNQLAGMDVRPDLVAMTKVRLVMLARSRGGFQSEGADIDRVFPMITVGDMLDERTRLQIADGYLFNPPFGGTADHRIDTWATGKVNSAAIFLASLVSNAATLAAGCSVACTQLSERCNSGPIEGDRGDLEGLRSSGQLDGRSCAGSMTIMLEGGARRAPEATERHAAFVASSVATPMCYKRADQTRAA